MWRAALLLASGEEILGDGFEISLGDVCAAILLGMDERSAAEGLKHWLERLREHARGMAAKEALVFISWL